MINLTLFQSFVTELQQLQQFNCNEYGTKGYSIKTGD